MRSLTRATTAEPRARPPPRCASHEAEAETAAVEDFDGVFGDEREYGKAEEVGGEEHGDEPWEWLGTADVVEADSERPDVWMVVVADA